VRRAAGQARWAGRRTALDAAAAVLPGLIASHFPEHAPGARDRRCIFFRLSVNLIGSGRDLYVLGRRDGLATTRRGIMRFISIKSALVAAALAVGVLASSSIIVPAAAQAHGFGFGGHGHGFGFGHGHGFGHGFGHWRGPVFGIYGGDYDGGCVIRRYVDEDGDEVIRKLCY
jgi:hypothetical protein